MDAAPDDSVIYSDSRYACDSYHDVNDVDLLKVILRSIRSLLVDKVMTGGG